MRRVGSAGASMSRLIQEVLVHDLRPCSKGSLRAFFSVEMEEAVIVSGFKLMETNGRRWIAVPTYASGAGRCVIAPARSRNGWPDDDA